MVALIVMATPALAAEEITFEGGGWGHGVGMPQYGAKAMAEAGDEWEEIIHHYYQGADIGTAGQGSVVGHPNPFLVGVAPNSTSQTFEAMGGSVTLCLDGDCSLTAQPGETWRLTNTGGSCRYYRDDVAQGSAAPCNGEMVWSNPPNVRVWFPDIPNTGRTYARGKIEFVPVPNNANAFHLLLEIGLESYLYGLGEMPSSWPSESLQAQAVAARSYAVSRAYGYRNLPSNLSRMNQCACHLMGTTADQAYIGWAKESETSGGTNWGALWVTAVNATKAKVAIDASEGNRAIQAFYFSSSGGATDNSEDVGFNHRPYLRSVSDGGATVWTPSQEKSFTRAQLASLLGLDSVFHGAITARYQSGSPKSVVFTGTQDGGLVSKVYTGTQLRSLLGLRSHYVTAVVGFYPPFDSILAGNFNGGAAEEVSGWANGSIWTFGYSSGGMMGSVWTTFSAKTGWTDHLVGDFNNDGRDDIAHYRASTGNWTVSRSTGSGFVNSTWTTFSAVSGWTEHLVGDFNNDGRDDIAHYRASTGNWTVSRSTGSGFTNSTWSTIPKGTSWSDHAIADVNGDGRDDIVSGIDGGFLVGLSTGSAFDLDAD
jgi:SpoIID/LytB domain protein